MAEGNDTAPIAVDVSARHGLWADRRDGIAETCERLGRWEFLCLIAPLRITGGTGSPVKPDRGDEGARQTALGTAQRDDS